MRRQKRRSRLERLQAELREAVEFDRRAYAQARAATAVVEQVKLAILDAETEPDARDPIRDM